MINNLPKTGMKEFRAYSGSIQANNNEGHIIEGHAAVFNQKTNICDCFYEIIDSSAFDKTDFRDVLFSVNHDLDKIPLARSRNNNDNSTLKLSVDSKGLLSRAVLDIESNSEAKALYSSVQRGDMNGMSFIFIVRGQRWENLDSDIPTRIITDISRVIEVSAVSFPAYEQTDIIARSAGTLDNAKLTLDSARAENNIKTTAEKRNTLLKYKE